MPLNRIQILQCMWSAESSYLRTVFFTLRQSCCGWAVLDLELGEEVSRDTYFFVKPIVDFPTTEGLLAEGEVLFCVILS